MPNVKHLNHFVYFRARLHEHFFLWQRPVVTETMANYLLLNTATKSVKETKSKNLC